MGTVQDKTETNSVIIDKQIEYITGIQGRTSKTSSAVAELYPLAAIVQEVRAQQATLAESLTNVQCGIASIRTPLDALYSSEPVQSGRHVSFAPTSKYLSPNNIFQN